MTLEPSDMIDYGPFTCILHADCWNNNLMYRYDDKGNAQEMKLVDWQITRLGHPATDILHFLLTSTSPELRRQHRRSLIDLYYDKLSSSLKKLGLEGCERTRFDADIKSRLLRGMFAALMAFPVIFDDAMIQDFEKKDSETAKEDKETSLNMEEIMKDFGQAFKIELMLANGILCSRIVGLIQEIRSAIVNDDW